VFALEFQQDLIFFYLKLFFYVFNRFDMLISKVIFKNKKNIVLMYFRAKTNFKKQPLSYSQTPLLQRAL